jgi:hypothetical protein
MWEKGTGYFFELTEMPLAGAMCEKAACLLFHPMVDGDAPMYNVLVTCPARRDDIIMPVSCPTGVVSLRCSTWENNGT